MANPESVNRYWQWRQANPDAIEVLSEHERILFQILSQEDYNFILQLKLFLVEATEHIAEQLVPVYNTIVKAGTVEELLPFTTHPRQVVRFAAEQKIDILEGRPIRRETVVLFENRWPNNGWNAPRKRAKLGSSISW